MRLPIKARLTLISTAMMAVVLAAVGLFIYIRLQSDLMHAVDAGLRSRAEQIVDDLPRGGKLASPGGLIEPDEAFAQVLAPDGSVLDSSVGVQGAVLVDAASASHLEAPSTYEALVSVVGDQIPARLFAVPTGDGQIVVVGASVEDQQDALNRLAVLSLAGGFVALALSALVGWVVAGHALRPVERMRSEAAAISLSELDRRLAVPETGDELARLGETLNEMLERIEVTLDRERRFVSDASHELRTPLANLKAEIELALRRPRDDEDLRQALRSAGEETERLIQLAQDLLILARSEQGTMAVARELANVSTLIRREVVTFSARAADQHVVIQPDVTTDLMFNIDVQRVRQALANLLDNALRHSPRGAVIEVNCRLSSEELMIEVRDAGEGFDPSFLDEAFEPFSRADVGRTRSDGGSGLGLAIVRAVIEAHDGSVTAANRPGGGGVVTLRIPA